MSSIHHVGLRILFPETEIVSGGVFCVLKENQVHVPHELVTVVGESSGILDVYKTFHEHAFFQHVFD
jgi:hypothetical protein